MNAGLVKSYIILSILILLLPAASPGQEHNFQKIDSIVQKRMAEYRIQGLSLGIIRNGKIYYCKGYGFTNTDKTYPVLADTRFEISSITKLFTATAIMQLVEQGKLDLSRRLVEYLPDFQLKDKRYRDISLLHLLTHSSGLGWDHYLTKSSNDPASLKQFIYSLKDATLNFAPGTKFSGETYSNTGYDILGYLVEKITDTLFDRYIELNILNRTGMVNCSFSPEKIPVDKFARPQKLDGNTKEINRFNLYGEIKDINPVLKYPQLDIVGWTNFLQNKPDHHPSGWLYAPVSDLVNWMLYNLKVSGDSIPLSPQFLTRPTLQNMWSLKRSIENKNTAIGLGWWRYTDSVKGNYVFHVGRSPGYCSTLMIFPEKNEGIVILCNGMYADQVVWNSLPFEIMKEAVSNW